MTKGWLW